MLGPTPQPVYERVPTIVMDGDHITSVYTYLPWASSLAPHDWQAQVYTHHLQRIALRQTSPGLTAVESSDLVMGIAHHPSDTQISLRYRRFIPQHAFDFTPTKRFQTTNWQVFSRRLAPLVTDPLSPTTAPVLHGGLRRQGPAPVVEFTMNTVPFGTAYSIPGVWIYGADDVHEEAVHRICLQTWRLYVADHQSDSEDNPVEWLNSSRVLLAVVTPDPAGLDPQTPRFHACFYDVTVKPVPAAFQLWGCDAVVDQAPELCTTNVTPVKPYTSLPTWVRDKHCPVQALTDDAFDRACKWVFGPTQYLVSLDDDSLQAEPKDITDTGPATPSVESLPDPARQRCEDVEKHDSLYPCTLNGKGPTSAQQNSPLPSSTTASPAAPVCHFAVDGTIAEQPGKTPHVPLPTVAVTTTAISTDASLPAIALNLGTVAAPNPLPPSASAEQVLIAQQRTIIDLLQQQLDIFSQRRQFAEVAPWRGQQTDKLGEPVDFVTRSAEQYEPIHTHAINDCESGQPLIPGNPVFAAGTPARSITRKYVRVNQQGNCNAASCSYTTTSNAIRCLPDNGPDNAAWHHGPREARQGPVVPKLDHATMPRAPSPYTHGSNHLPYQPATGGNGGMVMEAYEETEYITHYPPAHPSRANPGQMHTRRYRAARMGHMPIYPSTHQAQYEDTTLQPSSRRPRSQSAKTLPPPTTDPMQALLSRVNDVLSVSTSASTADSPSLTNAAPHGHHSTVPLHPLLPPRQPTKSVGISASVGVAAPASTALPVSSLLHDLTPMTKKYLQNLRQRDSS
ncbi:hypothetical protein H4R34_003976 [Dimargaris verticillata]|uniref:Uncharacterized protein n=1 Tax=Dimargaris verticillata TaxID=2761393 RepID=A0A9W8AZQ4_9FUNG|nr:hypothetical protein H4R34_003976 [Dimargaris verticillata]